MHTNIAVSYTHLDVYKRQDGRCPMKRTLPWQTPARNYYPLPKVLCRLGLSPGEIAVYSFLMSVSYTHLLFSRKGGHALEPKVSHSRHAAAQPCFAGGFCVRQPAFAGHEAVSGRDPVSPAGRCEGMEPVSYTHLPPPTTRCLATIFPRSST